MVDIRSAPADLPLLSVLASDVAGDATTTAAAEEEVPAYLNPINSSGGFQFLSFDKLSVRYLTSNLHGHDVGVVQANCPAPSNRLAYYFEMFVKCAGLKGQMSIGFTCENFKMRRQPG